MLAERLQELDQREGELDRREAVFLTDTELRLDELEQLEQEILSRSEHLAQKEVDLEAFVARAQSELHRRETALRAV